MDGATGFKVMLGEETRGRPGSLAGGNGLYPHTGSPSTPTTPTSPRPTTLFSVADKALDSLIDACNVSSTWAARVPTRSSSGSMISPSSCPASAQLRAASSWRYVMPEVPATPQHPDLLCWPLDGYPQQWRPALDRSQGEGRGQRPRLTARRWPHHPDRQTCTSLVWPRGAAVMHPTHRSPPRHQRS